MLWGHGPLWDVECCHESSGATEHGTLRGTRDATGRRVKPRGKGDLARVFECHCGWPSRAMDRRAPSHAMGWGAPHEASMASWVDKSCHGSRRVAGYRLSLGDVDYHCRNWRLPRDVQCRYRAPNNVTGCRETPCNTKLHCKLMIKSKPQSENPDPWQSWREGLVLHQVDKWSTRRIKWSSSPE